MDDEHSAINVEILELNTQAISEKIRDFSDLLKSIDSLDNKKKQLFKEIYENAITDRQNAYAMFVKLAAIAGSKSTEQAVHGRTIATFLERMSKSNDQLIRLADLIIRSEQGGDDINPEEMFDKIKKRN